MTDALKGALRRVVPLTGWLIAWIVVWIVNLVVYGLREYTGLVLYSDASQHFLDGSKIYRTFGIDTMLHPFTYPPFMTIPTVSLLPFPEIVQRIIWAGLNAGLLIVTISLITQLVRPMILSIASRRKQNPGALFAIFWILVGGVTIRHVLSPLENQSHDVIILTLIAAGIAASTARREVLVGVFWGTATALKLTPLLFLVLLVVQGRMRASITMLIVVLVLTILPDVLVPNSTGSTHLYQFYKLVGSAAVPGQDDGGQRWKSWYPLNQNLSGSIYRLTAEPYSDYEYMEELGSMFPVVSISDGVRDAIKIPLQVAILIAVVIVALRTRGPPAEWTSTGYRHLAQAGVVVSAMLLLSPQSSKSHFIVLLFPAAAVVMHLILRRRDWVDILVLLIAFLVGTLTSKGLLGRVPGEFALVIGTVAFTAFVLGLGSMRAALFGSADTSARTSTDSPGETLTPG